MTADLTEVDRTGWRPSGHFLIALFLLALAAVGLWMFFRQRTTALDRQVAAEIRMVVGGPRPRSRPTELSPRRIWEELRKVYRGRDERPAWTDGGSVRSEAVQLLAALREMRDQGIEPARYDYDSLLASAAEIRRTDADTQEAVEALARWDVRMTRAFLLAAQDLRDGRVPRDSLDRNGWGEKRREDLHKVLARALDDGQPRRVLLALAPRDSGYLRLVAALARHREIEAAGGWPTLPKDTELKRGADGAQVAKLRARLAASGDLAAGTHGSFDKNLESAVRAFQTRHGLDPTGRVEATTRDALNVPVAQRIHQIELNLERRRWLPDSLAEPRVEVNVAGFQLAVRDSGRTVMGMPVVVGRTDTQTPIFSDEISYLEVNPVWRLPQRIVTNEIVPLLAKDREYFAKQNMVVTWREGTDTTTLDPLRVDWTVGADSVSPYLVTQRAGPENPLGRIKIMCPNEYDVYLHDTPARHLFGARNRAMSHGCVRLERPVDLARRVLGQQPERDSLDALVERGEWKRIGLKRKIPVHFLYWTSWVDDHGAVQFRRDLYGLDRRLEQALRGDGLATFQVNLPIEGSVAAP